MNSQSTVKKLAILSFHKIGEPPANGWKTWFYTPEATFVSYLRYLKESDWQVIDVATFLSGLASPDRFPDRAALLTFDDGYQSLRDVALPALRRFGYPAVLFVPTAFIGGRNSFDADTEPDEAICAWDDLRALERGGVSIQSHGITHRPFSLLDPDQQKDELVQSKAMLEAGLGKPVEVFAYPYGDSGTDMLALNAALQKAGYRAACLYGGKANSMPIVDVYRLARVAMGLDTDLITELAAR